MHQTCEAWTLNWMRSTPLPVLASLSLFLSFTLCGTSQTHRFEGSRDQMLSCPLPNRKLPPMTSTVQNEWNGSSHPLKSAKGVNAVQKQALYQTLFHRWALECMFHRVSFLIPQAASIYPPNSLRCYYSLCVSPEKGPPHIKGVIKAGLPLRGWSPARDVNVSAPAVIDASSCRITVLFFASVEHSCDYSAATRSVNGRTADPRIVWKCIFHFAHSNGFYERMAKHLNSLKVTFTPCKWQQTRSNLDSRVR